MMYNARTKDRDAMTDSNNRNPCKGNLGFSAIELLICIALVAMLAAIAVPNYMQADTSSKIAQAKQDLNSLKIGLEVYETDLGAYPWQNHPPVCLGTSPYTTKRATLERLTTPVSYLGENTPFYDPFVADGYYEGATLSTWTPLSDPGSQNCYFYNARNLIDTSTWGQTQEHDVDPYWYFLESAGPDLSRHETYQALNAMATDTALNRARLSMTIYDPTNGSVSRGSIWDIGGDPQGRGISMAWVINNSYTSHVAGWGEY